MPSQYKILRMKDKFEKTNIELDKVFSVPHRLLFVARTGLGKTLTLSNYLMNPNFPYGDIWNGMDIYIFSPSISNDFKLQQIIKYKQIPQENLFHSLDEDSLNAVLEFITEQYEEALANDEKPRQSLVILDDCLAHLKDKENGGVQDLFIRGRHINCSVWTTLQHYTKCPYSCRSNSSGIIVFQTNNKQLEGLEHEHNILDNKKQFLKMAKDITKDKHNPLIINYTNSMEEMYLDGEFNVIDTSKYVEK